MSLDSNSNKPQPQSFVSTVTITHRPQMLRQFKTNDLQSNKIIPAYIINELSFKTKKSNSIHFFQVYVTS